MSGPRGARVLLTRTARGCAEWAPRIEARGHTPVAFPCIRREAVEGASLAATLQEALDGADWLVLPSRAAVRVAARLLGARLPEGLRVALLGAASARACRVVFGRADLCSAAGTAEGLAGELHQRLAVEGAEGRIVVTAGAAGGRRELEAVLASRGVIVRRVDVYRTIPFAEPPDRHALDGLADVVFLASPSAVQGLMNQATVPDVARVITIGPTTTRASLEAGLRVEAEAPRRSLEAMLEAMA